MQKARWGICTSESGRLWAVEVGHYNVSRWTSFVDEAPGSLWGSSCEWSNRFRRQRWKRSSSVRKRGGKVAGGSHSGSLPVQASTSHPPARCYSSLLWKCKLQFHNHFPFKVIAYFLWLSLALMYVMEYDVMVDMWWSLVSWWAYVMEGDHSFSMSEFPFH